MTTHELRELLSAMRWNAAEINLDATIESLIRYPSYYLVLVDGKMPSAPDDRNRALATVFTTEEAREEFRKTLPTGQLNQQIIATANGVDLFTSLGSIHLDGVVFDCCGPYRPIAFQPGIVKLACDRIKAGRVPDETATKDSALGTKPAATEGTTPDTADVDFDALAKEAFADNNPSPTPAMDRLWSAVFALAEWHFIVHPGGQHPVIAPIDGRLSLLAFTDSQRATRCARDNGIVDESGNVQVMTVPTDSAVGWIQGHQQRGRLTHLQFNFGDQGWFSPAENLHRIRHHLEAKK